MGRPAAALLLAALVVAGCGGSSKPGKPPEYAYLTEVQVEGSSVRFAFESPPRQTRASYEPRSSVVGCGSGLPIALRGRAYVLVHFQPAASAKIEGEKVVPTYDGPRRLSGPGPVLGAVKSCDFEADLAWAIGLERRLPLKVTSDGSTVTVSFG